MVPTLQLSELAANMAGQGFHPLAGPLFAHTDLERSADLTFRSSQQPCPTCRRVGRWLKGYVDYDYSDFLFWAYCPNCGTCERL